MHVQPRRQSLRRVMGRQPDILRESYELTLQVRLRLVMIWYAAAPTEIDALQISAVSTLLQRPRSNTIVDGTVPNGTKAASANKPPESQSAEGAAEAAEGAAEAAEEAGGQVEKKDEPAADAGNASAGTQQPSVTATPAKSIKSDGCPAKSLTALSQKEFRRRGPSPSR